MKTIITRGADPFPPNCTCRSCVFAGDPVPCVFDTWPYPVTIRIRNNGRTQEIRKGTWG